jgi:hypothetical protein
LELDEYKREDVIETKYKTKQQVLLEKQSKTNKHYYYIIIALNHYSFYFFLSKHTKLKKNKLKDIQSKIQENIINAVTGQEIERKK